MEELQQLVQNLESEIAGYNARKTKSASARIRKLTQRLNHIGPTIRKDLVAADKLGYK